MVGGFRLLIHNKIFLFKIVFLVVPIIVGIAVLLFNYGNGFANAQKNNVATTTVSKTKVIDMVSSPPDLIPAVTHKLDDQIIVDRVKLDVKGIVVQEFERTALISVNNAPTLPFKIGDRVSIGLLLQDIEANYIIVKHTKLLERIGIQETNESKDSSFNFKAEYEETIEKSNEEILVRVGNEHLGQSRLPEEIERFSEDQYLVRRDYLTSQLNSPDLFQQALVKRDENDRLVFEGILPGSLLDHLGFRIGDVISDVNGRPVMTLLDAMKVRDDFENSSEMTIKILRNNSPQHLYYNFK